MKRGKLIFLLLALLIGVAAICELVNFETRYYSYEYVHNIYLIRNITRPAALFSEIGAIATLFINRKRMGEIKKAKEYFCSVFPKNPLGIFIHLVANFVISAVFINLVLDWTGYLASPNVTLAFFNPFLIFAMNWDQTVMYFRPALLIAASAPLVISWIALARNAVGLIFKPRVKRKKRRPFSTFKYVAALDGPTLKIKFYLISAICAVSSLVLALIFFWSLDYRNEEQVIVSFTAEILLLALWRHYDGVFGAYAKLTYYIKEMYVRGDEAELELNESRLINNSLERLNNIKRGFFESVDRRVKSERMKTELITNVSHDLKTPLTSIINYVDLLKREGISSNNAPDYLDILEQKSSRLKALIEDLFEASKLRSGNAELERSQINVVDLLKQAVGELRESFIERGIDLRISYPSEEIYLNLDGKKIWRAFENVLTNIIKYSKYGTRAYISVEKTTDKTANDKTVNDKVAITFRNISEYEIKFDPEELFERFKRADESRSEEGSGLGLSIAEGIIKLHGGEMDIVVDGDLFKVIIIF
jgi:signal transduction histidine kinase